MFPIQQKQVDQLIFDKDFIELQSDLLASPIVFTQIMYNIRTGRPFEISKPICRQSHHILICQALFKIFTGEITRLIINVPPRYSKAIDVSTPILTKKGWSTAENIKEGDYIVGSKGWVKVLGIYPQGILNSRKVVFSDGQSVVCSDDHIWSVRDRYTPTFKNLTTSEIESTLYECDGHKHWRIPMVNGEYGETKPFIDPYLFGCWLGDGHTYYAAITTMDKEIVEAFEKEGHILTKHTHQSAGKATTYGITKNGFSTTLRKYNLLKNKHIPADVYLWNKEDRIALLQGLMDTDGCCGKNGQVSFCNTNKDLIKGVGYLVNSLGGKYTTYKVNDNNPNHNEAVLLSLRLPDEISPFRLIRKKERVSFGIKCSPRRFIANILKAKSCEMVCFRVNADDNLFAVGEGLILTHNTELLINFVSWCLAHFADANFLYISYSHSLAKKQTQTIREIINLAVYRKLFDVRIAVDSSAKDDFETSRGGSVYAAGSGGAITGRGAGIKNCERFGGAIILDDVHKPDEVASDTIRNGVIDWYYNTMQSRLNNGVKTPIILIGQRLHEADLPSRLIESGEWETLILPALDEPQNALWPTMHTKEDLLKMKEQEPYVFASQMQQDPQPAGGGIFKKEWFITSEYTPEILATFITGDSAETDKTYNDATVFSFWGLYKIKQSGIELDLYGLHWIDCLQDWVEPKDLEQLFLDFYVSCMRYDVKPQFAAIEKKSTGSVLLSVLSKIQGLNLVDISRTSASGSKTQRFLEIQPIIGAKRVTLPLGKKHTKMCIDHCTKITANDSHRYDDIADTLYDGVKIALIDKTLINLSINPSENNQNNAVKKLAEQQKRRQQLRRERTW